LQHDLVPFFSRRIGLDSDGNPIPIAYGTKLTGRAGDWNLGLLDVETEEKGGVPQKDLFVTRISRNVGEQSTVGGIFTSGDPVRDVDNQLYGADYDFRTSTLGGDKNLTSSVWALRTETEGRRGDDLA